MQQTVDADVNLLQTDSEEIPVCGLSFSSAAAADAVATDEAAVLADATTAVCGSSFCFAAAAVLATDADAMTTCAANQTHHFS